jgi:organic hydroperoxide reductase OsmC/OhrA
MTRHRASCDWSLGETPGEAFLKGRYPRGHAVEFEDGPRIRGSASAHVVGNRWAEPGAVDPEQMLVSALCACHMLSFLNVAREHGFVVDRYRDEAEGLLEKTPQGRPAVTCVTLRPAVGYRGRAPTAAEAEHLHHLAHEACFIANSVRTEVVVQAPPTGEDA